VTIKSDTIFALTNDGITFVYKEPYCMYLRRGEGLKRQVEVERWRDESRRRGERVERRWGGGRRGMNEAEGEKGDTKKRK
jgi:hypothetical protein